jgi:glycosyltransferase involved in cell wall biosynthesis
MNRSNIRILYVTDGFAPFVVGGTQAIARRQIETLHSAGYVVVSISSRETDEALINVPWRNVRCAWPKRSLMQRFSPWRYVSDLRRFSREVAEVADEIRPHCVYSDGPLLYDYLVRDRTNRAPTIFHPHGMEMFQPKGTLAEDVRSLPLRGITRFHAQRADITISQSTRGQLPLIIKRKLRVPTQRIRVVPNAVSLDQALNVAAKTSQRRRFLFVGRNEPRKGVQLLLRAFAERNDVTLDIVGIPSLPAGTPPHIRTHGVVQHRGKVATAYRDADFLVVTSYAEGMPTVILEAFAAGTPVIGTDVGATADLVRTGETGFLIPPGDVGALGHAIEQAAAIDDHAYARLSAACLDLARGGFSIGAATERLVALFDEVCLHGVAHGG